MLEFLQKNFLFVLVVIVMLYLIASVVVGNNEKYLKASKIAEENRISEVQTKIRSVHGLENCTYAEVNYMKIVSCPNATVSNMYFESKQNKTVISKQ